MRRDAARSAGPKLMPWMRGLEAAISSRLATPRCGLENGVHEDRTIEAGPGLELREQAIDVVDVPRTLDLGHHHDLDLVADLLDDLRYVVQEVGRGELVDARPQRRVAELHLPADPEQPSARGLLLVERHGVLEVAEQDVDLRGQIGRLLDHFRIREVHEVDHPGRLERDISGRLGRVDGEGLEEVAGVAHGGDRIDFFQTTFASGPQNARCRRPIAGRSSPRRVWRPAPVGERPSRVGIEHRPKETSRDP